MKRPELPRRCCARQSPSQRTWLHGEVEPWLPPCCRFLLPLKELEKVKRKMLGLFVQTLTMILMSSHCYSFGGRLYLQRGGAGIGLRASACLARIIMCSWDAQWAKMQLDCGLLALIFIRYVDDLRLYVFPLNKGWYWDG